MFVKLSTVVVVVVATCAAITTSSAASLSAESSPLSSSLQDQEDLTQYVDTRIGGGGSGYGIGQLNPGPQVPFGSIRIGPDTSLGLEPARLAFDHFSGYFYHDTWIETFSHARVVGAGEGDLKNFGVQITHLNPSQNPSLVTKDIWYRSPFPVDPATTMDLNLLKKSPEAIARTITSSSTREEIALPAYYAANVPAATTRAELTVCGAFSGKHRYSCVPVSSPTGELTGCNFALDICHDSSLDFLDGIGKTCKGAQILEVAQGTLPTGEAYTNVTATMLDGGSFLRSSPRGSIPLFIHMTVVVKATGSSTPIPTAISGWENRTFTSTPQGKYTTSGSLGLVLVPSIPTSAGTVQYDITSGLSWVSSANAKLNLDKEIADMQARHNIIGPVTFDDCRSKAHDEWNKILNRVKVVPRRNSTGTSGDATLTNQYRTFVASVYNVHRIPTRYDETADGSFVRLNFSIGKAATINVPTSTGTKEVAIHRRSDLSIWDIYRTHMPLMSWLSPKVAHDTAHTMLEMKDEQGILPRWPLANVETNCMVGRHSAVILADFMMKGLPFVAPRTTSNIGPDNLFNRSIDAMVSAVKAQCLESIDQHGYVPQDHDNYGASKTLDYALDAGALVNLGTTLNITALANDVELQTCSQSYRNVFFAGSPGDNRTSETKWLICPKYANGTFSCPNPYLPYFLFKEKYTEGNGAQYRFYVPHDPRGLVSLFPSPDDFVNTLQQFFQIGTEWPFDNTLPNWAFWAGNEPSLLAPYLFSYAGPQYAHLTQYWVQKSLERYYNDKPGGIPGNDDYGTMSAFLYFGYCGVYPAASTANAEYALTTPYFDEFHMSMDDEVDLYFSPWRGQLGGSFAGNETSAKFLVIKAYNRPANGTMAYIQRVVINGVTEVQGPIITQRQLMRPDGSNAPSTIEFYLTDRPSVFGGDPNDAVYQPPSGEGLIDPLLRATLDRTLADSHSAVKNLKSLKRPPMTRSN